MYGRLFSLELYHRGGINLQEVINPTLRVSDINHTKDFYLQKYLGSLPRTSTLFVQGHIFLLIAASVITHGQRHLMGPNR